MGAALLCGLLAARAERAFVGADCPRRLGPDGRIVLGFRRSGYAATAALSSLFPGSAAQHEVMRCRPGIVTNSESATIPDQRCTTSCCIASGKHRLYCAATAAFVCCACFSISRLIRTACG